MTNNTHDTNNANTITTTTTNNNNNNNNNNNDDCHRCLFALLIHSAHGGRVLQQPHPVRRLLLAYRHASRESDRGAGTSRREVRNGTQK